MARSKPPVSDIEFYRSTLEHLLIGQQSLVADVVSRSDVPVAVLGNLLRARASFALLELVRGYLMDPEGSELYALAGFYAQDVPFDISLFAESADKAE